MAHNLLQECKDLGLQVPWTALDVETIKLVSALRRELRAHEKKPEEPKVKKRGR